MSKLIKPQSNFTTIPNHIINDKRLSFKAKGLFFYLISKPDGWAFSHNRIMLDTNDGERSILSGLKELESFGLLSRSRVRVAGIFKGVDYVLSFDISPNLQNVDLVSPNLHFVDVDNVDLQNVDNNKDSLIKKDIDLEREIIESELMPIASPVNLDLDNVVCNPLFHIDEFLNEVTKSHGIKSPTAYRSVILESLHDTKHKRHNRTMLAYQDFVDRFQRGLIVPKNNFRLPDGVSIFDIIGRG